MNSEIRAYVKALMKRRKTCLDPHTVRFSKDDFMVKMGGGASYIQAIDTIFISDSFSDTHLIHGLTHELTERHLLAMIGDFPINGTIVSHILSPYKAGNWGRWRLWGKKP